MAGRIYGEIGMRLSHHRRRLNISREEMSNYLGIAQEKLSLYECGYELPTELEMLKLSEKLKVHYNKLIFGRGGKPKWEQ